MPGNPALGHLPPGEHFPRSSLPMREPSSDQIESAEQRCCISSDADGRILATSFPLFSHPHSIRPIPDYFYHLERFDSENTGTAIAQVGRDVSPVPSSQKLENAKFHRWLDRPSSPVSSHVAVEGSKKSQEYRLSPGVSEMSRPKQESLPFLSMDAMTGEPDRPRPIESVDVNKLLSSSDFSEILGRYDELVSRLRRLEEFDTVATHGLSSGHAAERDMVNGTGNHENDIVSTASSASSHILTEGIHTEVGQKQDIVGNDDADIPSLEPIPAERSSFPPPLAAQQASAASDETDPNEAWKTFVFGSEGIDEVGKVAFEEAKYAAVRSLQPSDSSFDDNTELGSDGNSNIATVGTVYTGHDEEVSDSTSFQSSSEVPASLEAAYHPSSSGSELGPASINSNPSVQTSSVEANPGTSSLSGAESIVEASGSGDPISEDAESSALLRTEAQSFTSASDTATPSMTTSMAVAPAQSEVEANEAVTSGEQFRFIQPKLFVGSRSNLSQPQRITGPSVGISLTKRKRGRMKKRANDGRADIRGLPNYSSDPIEEFEEERTIREARAPKSLFPALELS